ncbi:MAG TPA: succinate dehydrogenase cytochrome b subunit [Opitutaceae bacterium]|nr:succinate dehydrogenase cytochrome b subunit [Opitutaceae bacterium]
MNLVGALFRSSIGRKILMAVSGLILIGFVVGHLVGNLQVFQEPDHINGYAAFLRQLGPTLWIARLVILASAVVHIWAATVLTLENRRARGGEPYGVNYTIRATLASRTMRLTGYVVLAFVIYHLAHFTWGAAQSATFKENLARYTLQHDYRVAGFVTVPQGAVVEDVYNMVVLGFQNPLVSLFYIVAVGLLSFHLLHGFDSMFQTLGLRSSRWSGGLRKICVLFCALYFLGNLAIPGAVLLGRLQPHAPQPAPAPTAQR